MLKPNRSVMKKYIILPFLLIFCFSAPTPVSATTVTILGEQMESPGFDRPKKHKKAYGVRKQPKFRSCKSARKKVRR